MLQICYSNLYSTTLLRCYRYFSSTLHKTDLTLCLVKPGVASSPLLVENIQDKILFNKFLILAKSEIYWSQYLSEKFYAEHEGKFFHQRLVEFMSSGLVIAMVLAKQNGIKEWRKLIGPTKVYQVSLLIIFTSSVTLFYI